MVLFQNLQRTHPSIHCSTSPPWIRTVYAPVILAEKKKEKWGAWTWNPNPKPAIKCKPFHGSIVKQNLSILFLFSLLLILLSLKQFQSIKAEVGNLFLASLGEISKMTSLHVVIQGVWKITRPLHLSLALYSDLKDKDREGHFRPITAHFRERLLLFAALQR